MDKNCNIIRDLLPLYAEDLLSEDSRALVENHLEGCEECKQELESIKKDIRIPTPCEQTKIIEAFVAGMKKYKNHIFTIIFEVVIFVMMIIVGFGSLDMFLIAGLMIPVGFWGYILFRKHAFYMIPAITSASLLLCAILRFVSLGSNIKVFISQLLFYLALFILPSFLGIGTGALTHSIFKKRSKNAIPKRIVSMVLALVFLGLSLFTYYVFAGNPFVSISAMIEAKEYIDERFEHNDYFPYKVRYDCLFEGTYIVYVKSISSDDVDFKITFSHKGKLQKCDYDEKYKSNDQSILSLKYARYIDNALNKSDFSYEIIKTNSYYYFPYNKSNSDTWSNALTMENFNARDDYDLSTLGKTNGVILIEVYSKHTSIEDAKKVYLEFKDTLDELGIGFRVLRINLISAEHNIKASFSSICYEDITIEKIDDEIIQIKYQEID